MAAEYFSNTLYISNKQYASNAVSEQIYFNTKRKILIFELKEKLPTSISYLTIS